MQGLLNAAAASTGAGGGAVQGLLNAAAASTGAGGGGAVQGLPNAAAASTGAGGGAVQGLNAAAASVILNKYALRRVVGRCSLPSRDLVEPAEMPSQGGLRLLGVFFVAYGRVALGVERSIFGTTQSRLSLLTDAGLEPKIDTGLERIRVELRQKFKNYTNAMHLHQAGKWTAVDIDHLPAFEQAQHRCLAQLPAEALVSACCTNSERGGRRFDIIGHGRARSSNSCALLLWQSTGWCRIQGL